MTKSVFRQVPKTGVIFTTSSAMKLGFYRGHPDWCNFGQGQPETGYLEGGLERISHIDIDEGDHDTHLSVAFLNSAKPSRTCTMFFTEKIRNLNTQQKMSPLQVEVELF